MSEIRPASVKNTAGASRPSLRLPAEPYAHRHQPLGRIKVLEPAPPELRHYVRLIIVTRLVDHDERVQPVDALECRLIGVGGFADMGLASSLPASPMYHSSSSVIRPANDPFDAPDRYIAKDYMDLFRRGGRRGRKGIEMGVEPPRNDVWRSLAHTGVMR
jgi:hypothetical protein